MRLISNVGEVFLNKGVGHIADVGMGLDGIQGSIINVGSAVGSVLMGGGVDLPVDYSWLQLNLDCFEGKMVGLQWGQTQQGHRHHQELVALQTLMSVMIAPWSVNKITDVKK